MQPSPIEILDPRTAPEEPSRTFDSRYPPGNRVDIAAFVDLSGADCPGERRDLLELWRSAERAAVLAGEWHALSTN